MAGACLKPQGLRRLCCRGSAVCRLVSEAMFETLCTEFKQNKRTCAPSSSGQDLRSLLVAAARIERLRDTGSLVLQKICLVVFVFSVLLCAGIDLDLSL